MPSFIYSDENALKTRLGSLSRLLALGLVICSNSSVAPVSHLGFFCDDPAIKKPFSGDTITGLTLFLVSLITPGVVFILTEIIYHLVDKAHYKQGLKHGHQILRDFLYGFLYVFAATEILKLFFGELRPHFLDTCRPDVSEIECSEGRRITAFNCTGTGPHWLVTRDIYKSFPSGHAAMSVYTFIFVSCYIHSRIHLPNGYYIKFIRIWLQLCFLLWAVVCSVSRITDNRHFWWDVLVGAVIGLIGGCLNVKYFAQKKFKAVDQTKKGP